MTIPSQFYTAGPNPERKAIDDISSLGTGRSPHSVWTVAGASQDCIR
jgi:hypothetical protein